MHPPLEIHQHPSCKEYILALKGCHKDNPVAKFWGVCNQVAIDLNLCFKQEKVVKRAKNKERIAREQERLRARWEARRREEAAARGDQAAPAAAAGEERLPGFWQPEQRGIHTEQPAPAQ
ncbi:hypothetical protein ABPG75_002331 [Micractinium tetrahymenae]